MGIFSQIFASAGDGERLKPYPAPRIEAKNQEELLKRAQTQLDQADEERKDYIERLLTDSRKIGD